MIPGPVGFILGTVPAQVAGASLYRRLQKSPEITALRRSAATGLLSSIVATALYIPLGVGDWVNGSEDWRVSAFLGLCVGICQATLFKDRPRVR
jgi:hypothetical protein